MFSRRAFTLIELLIVVAIIAILAAIAVPNFLEAQVRAKVSRAKSDMRSMATALESYKVDTNWYPMDQAYYWGRSILDQMPSPPLNLLTSPVAYITSIPRDAFALKSGGGVSDGGPDDYGYKSDRDWRLWTLEYWEGAGILPDVFKNESGEPDYDTTKRWVLTSFGPDRTVSGGEWYMYGERVLNRCEPWPEIPGSYCCLYDPTNGTISYGDICRVGP